jgi:hypothetical protein
VARPSRIDTVWCGWVRPDKPERGRLVLVGRDRHDEAVVVGSAGPGVVRPVAAGFGRHVRARLGGMRSDEVRLFGSDLLCHDLIRRALDGETRRGLPRPSRHGGS